MTYSNIYALFFSPHGGTKKIVKHIAEAFDIDIIYKDLYLDKQDLNLQLTANDLLIVGLPVYGGRIPKSCADKLKNIIGDGGLAISLVVYGNRAYDDALLELSDILEANNFVLTAAAAFIAEHSMLQEVAKGRPDKEDLLYIDKFVAEVKRKIYNLDDVNYKIIVPGHRPYRSKSIEPHEIKPESLIYKPANSIFKKLWSKRNNPEWYI